jgi:hypothetical protein
MNENTWLVIAPQKSICLIRVERCEVLESYFRLVLLIVNKISRTQKYDNDGTKAKCERWKLKLSRKNMETNK